jgi:hypothetical protein
MSGSPFLHIEFDFPHTMGSIIFAAAQNMHNKLRIREVEAFYN